MDVHFLDATNDAINLFNDRALPVLKAVTGQDLGVEPEKWKNWWIDQLGYHYESDIPETKPTYTDFIAEAVLIPSYVHAACFAARDRGSDDGRPPADRVDQGRRCRLVAGDDKRSARVSAGGGRPSQSARRHTSNRRSVASRSSPPAFTASGKRVKAGRWRGSSRPAIACGWSAARSRSNAIEAGKTQPVYNLDVALNRDFFVGAKGLLVHDFSFVRPVIEPFDREPDGPE